MEKVIYQPPTGMMGNKPPEKTFWKRDTPYGVAIHERELGTPIFTLPHGATDGEIWAAIFAYGIGVIEGKNLGRGQIQHEIKLVLDMY